MTTNRLMLSDTTTSALLFASTVSASLVYSVLSGPNYAGIEEVPSPMVSWDEALADFTNSSRNDNGHHTSSSSIQEINDKHRNSNQNKSQDSVVIIDTRTPAEYEAAHVWDALSIPLMTNYQRHVLGKTYHQVGKSAAIALGWKIFSTWRQKQFVRHFEKYRGKTIYIYCWRGGMRSRIVTNLLLRAGFPTVYQVTGGYKSYLNQTVWNGLKQFATEYKPQFIVLFGHTGTGKTDLLRRLIDAGYPVVDLEGLAGHRSSVYGAVDLEQATQKMFSIGIYHQLLRYQNSPFIFIEGEAHKVGNVHLPQFLQERLHTAPVKVHITATMATRVNLLKREYLTTRNSVPQIREATEVIRKYIGNKNADHLLALLDAKDYDAFTEWLLVNHYDTNYRFAKKGHEYALTVSSDDMEACCEELQSFYDKLERNER